MFGMLLSDVCTSYIYVSLRRADHVIDPALSIADPVEHAHIADLMFLN